MPEEQGKDRKSFTLSKEAIRALTLRAAQDVADGLRDRRKAESEIVEEAIRMILGLPLPDKEGVTDDE